MQLWATWLWTSTCWLWNGDDDGIYHVGYGIITEMHKHIRALNVLGTAVFMNIFSFIPTTVVKWKLLLYRCRTWGSNKLACVGSKGWRFKSQECSSRPRNSVALTQHLKCSVARKQGGSVGQWGSAAATIIIDFYFTVLTSQSTYCAPHKMSTWDAFVLCHSPVASHTEGFSLPQLCVLSNAPIHLHPGPSTELGSQEITQWFRPWVTLDFCQ